MEQLKFIRRIICLCIIVLISDCGYAKVIIDDSYTLTGTVYDKKDNNPIIGASVVVEGTNNGTVTDFYGSFSLSLQNSKNTIIVSFVGYKSARFTITGSASGKIYMVDDTKKNINIASIWKPDKNVNKNIDVYDFGFGNVTTTKSPSQLYSEAQEYYYGKNGKTINYTKAFDLYKKAAEMGHTDAQFTIGIMCGQGKGTTKNSSEAFRW